MLNAILFDSLEFYLQGFGVMEPFQRYRALPVSILPHTVPGWIIARLAERLRLPDLQTCVLNILQEIEGDHRLPKGQLAIKGTVDEPAGEREGILELRGLESSRWFPIRGTTAPTSM
jgi:hypothetical protein